VAICGGLAGGPWLAAAHRIARPTRALVGWLSGLVGLELGVRVAPRVEVVLAADTFFAAIRPALVARDASTGAVVERVVPRVGARGLAAVRFRVGRPTKSP
jgi:hypothetical protein